MNIGPTFSENTASEAHHAAADWIVKTGREPDNYEIRTYPEPGAGGSAAVIHVRGTDL